MDEPSPIPVRLYLLLVSVWALVFLVVGATATLVYDVTDTLEVRRLYRMESYFRLPDSHLTVFNLATETSENIDSDVLMSQRNELGLDIESTPHTHKWADWAPPVKAVLQLRAFYDSDRLISTSGGQGKFQHLHLAVAADAERGSVTDPVVLDG